ncbi:MAG: Tex family protein [Tuberibacillus sp.]
MQVKAEEKDKMIAQIGQELGLKNKQVQNVIQLLSDDNTIPFIARYRKELTGGLNEVEINAINEKWQYAMHLYMRKEEVLRLIEEQGKLTEELKKDILKAEKLQDVEDLYLPYKQKRRTRATIAKEKGLEPLADWLMSLPNVPVESEAAKYLSEELEVDTVEAALEGACDIIAEKISDDAAVRKYIRDLTFKKGVMETEKKKNAEDERGVYEMYYEYEEKVNQIVPHRVLAINRGEKDNVLKVSIRTPEDELTAWIERRLLKGKAGSTTAEEALAAAARDAYKRLIGPAIEREIRQSLTEKAEAQAIHVFSENLQQLLMQPPIKNKIVLGVDPAYRTGCKLAVVDATGKVLHISVIYPTPPKSDVEGARKKVLSLIDEFGIEMIAIGNGTASRETEQFIAETIQQVNNRSVYYLIVNEAGASVYSASELAREEFPDLQTEERSAVSIARRLQDPLAELVKIDPKSVGVGQYQHDVSQKALTESLGFVVETVVNRVGVNVNTASVALLQYVAGLSKTTAKNIVKRREEDGPYTSRADLKTVPRLGEKSFQQCAGFLMVPDSQNILDRTPIHPESYDAALAFLKYIGCTVNDIGTDALKEKLKSIDAAKIAEVINAGEPPLRAIIDALIRPGRDPRDELPKPLLRTDVLDINDIKVGMSLEGTVRNVVDFGAFVDIGVKQDGLVHISKLTDRFVKHPLDVVQTGQIVNVWVDGVDTQKGRISLSMIPPKEERH